MNAGRALDALVAERVCKKCGGTRRMKLKTGYTQCLDCHNARNRAYQKINRKRRPSYNSEQFKRYARKWKLAKRYGITVEQYNAMLISQNSQCLICGHKHEEKKPLHVDHDHRTGQIRALLCHRCNPGLALFDESPDRLESAANYLRLAALKAMGMEV